MNRLLILPGVVTFRPNGLEPTITRLSALPLWKWRAPALGNPAQNAGFRHSHRAGDGGPLLHPRAKPAKIEGFYRFSLRTVFCGQSCREGELP